MFPTMTKTEQLHITREVLGISDGTLGSMTQENRYAYLDDIRATWVAWTLDAMAAGAFLRTWQDAWYGWLAEYA